jgi:hypothetical protein
LEYFVDDTVFDQRHYALRCFHISIIFSAGSQRAVGSGP